MSLALKKAARSVLRQHFASDLSYTMKRNKNRYRQKTDLPIAEPPEPTSFYDDTVAFFKLLPARTRAVFTLSRAKAKQLWSLNPPVTPANAGLRHLPSNVPGSVEVSPRRQGSRPSVCLTCRQPLADRHNEAIPEPSAEPPAASLELAEWTKITRKNFYKHPIFWARFLGYAIPLSFLLYVLYINYLPFGYHKTFTINVGSANDTAPSEFYLEPSKDLSDRMTKPDGSTYRTLNGIATAVFKPNVVLTNTNITVSVKGGDGISLIPPQINFDPNSIKWDYGWDFTKGVPKKLTNDNDRAFNYKGGTYFDGTARVEMLGSNNIIEDNSFTVYANWIPDDNLDNFQQIVGHYNWEILQEQNDVRFMIGRTNDKNGKFYSVRYQITNPEIFFNKPHTAIAVYSPSKLNNSGYIELYIDNIFVGRTMLGNDTIWNDYNGDKNLTFGKSDHGTANYFKGTLSDIRIANNEILPVSNKTGGVVSGAKILKFLITSNTATALNVLSLHVEKQ